MEPRDHDSNINYAGPSPGMEPRLIVDGVKEIEESLGFRIPQVIGEKIECRNHLERNARGSLCKIGEKGLLKQYITPQRIEEIVKNIRCARKHWNEQDIQMERKV